MLTVFVSHSSTHDAYAEWVRASVCERLRKKHYDVLVDADVLKAGDEWRSLLYHWLAQCHAAVLLLSDSALDSTWVRREVNLLLWRRALGSRVQIVPALLGDVRSDRIKSAGLSELELLQFARLPNSTSTKADALALAAKITDRFVALTTEPATDDPMRKWINRITSRLRKVDEMEGLLDAARALNVTDEDLDQVRLPEGPRFLAHQLLGHPSHKIGQRTVKAIAALSEYMEGWWAAALIEDVVPTWVNAESARLLLTAAQQPDHAVVLLNARDQHTGVDYIARATCNARYGYWHEVVGTTVGEDVVSELLVAFEKAVARLLNVEPAWTLEEVPERDGTCFLVVDPAGARLELVATAVRALQDRFPWLIVVVLVGDTAPETVVHLPWTPNEVVVLNPQLRPGEEVLARRDVADMRNLPNRQRIQVA